MYCGLCRCEVEDWDGHKHSPRHRRRARDPLLRSAVNLLASLRDLAPGCYPHLEAEVDAYIRQRGEEVDAQSQSTAA